MQLLLYGGLTREQYHLIAPEIDEANRKSLVAIPRVCALFYLVRLHLSYSHLPPLNRLVYIMAVLLFGLVAVLNHRFRCQYAGHRPWHGHYQKSGGPDARDHDCRKH